MICNFCWLFTFLIPGIVTWEVVHGGSNVWSFLVLPARPQGCPGGLLGTWALPLLQHLERLGLTHTVLSGKQNGVRKEPGWCEGPEGNVLTEVFGEGEKLPNMPAGQQSVLRYVRVSAQVSTDWPVGGVCP